MTDPQEGSKKTSGLGAAVGIAVGLPLGAAVGMLLLDNLAIGAGMGLVLGLAIGAGFEASRTDRETE